MRQAGTYSGMLSGGMSGRTGPHLLPLARIKKIMKKSGDDIKMISGEAPIIFSKACELFIEELTQRSWMVTLQGKRRTLHKEDVASAVIATDIFDFLVNLVSDHPTNSEDTPAVIETAYKKLSAIAAWENSKKASVEAKLKKMEEKLEKKKAEYAEKMKNKLAEIHQEAEEKRAMVEAKRGKDLLRIEETAAKFRASGIAPKKFLGCCGC